jgi:transglutaminase-like putative cysteine protease
MAASDCQVRSAVLHARCEQSLALLHDALRVGSGADASCMAALLESGRRLLGPLAFDQPQVEVRLTGRSAVILTILATQRRFEEFGNKEHLMIARMESAETNRGKAYLTCLLLLAVLAAGCSPAAPVSQGPTEATAASEPAAGPSEAVATLENSEESLAPEPVAASTESVAQEPAPTEPTAASAEANDNGGGLDSGGNVTTGDSRPAATPEGIATSDAEGPREYWDVIYIRGTRIGYGHTTITPLVEDGEPRVRIETINQLKMVRFGQTIEQAVKLVSFEKPDGTLIRFECELKQGNVPMVTRGQVEGNQLRFETSIGDRVQTQSIDWSPENGGFGASEASLARKPMQPGEQRALRELLPILNVVASVTMDAKQSEPTELLDGTYELLRIDSVVTIAAGTQLKSAVWTDRTGQVRKSYLEEMGQETFRVSRQEALRETEPGEFDLGLDAIVRVAEPIERPFETRRARYRLRLPDGDPAAAFVTCAAQRVQPIDAHTAELEVRSIGLDDKPTPTDQADESDLTPNTLLQSDDARVIELAAKAAGDETNPAQVALRLEKFVHEAIRKKNFSQAFASAAEVAEGLEGDCTEHSVLLAALARARGIPSRVAIGLVYVASQQGFGYHMWTEVFVNDHWVPLDATLGLGRVGATHLKLANSNLKDAAAYASFLPVARVLGRLAIDVQEVEY